MGDFNAIIQVLLDYVGKLIDNGVINEAIDTCVQWVDQIAIPLKDAIWLITH